MHNHSHHSHSHEDMERHPENHLEDAESTASSPDIWNPPTLDEVKEKTAKYVLGTYNRFPVAFHFGQGALLYDFNQKEYIDFLSGISVTSLGHGEADIIEAIREQADRLLHTSNLFYNNEQAMLAEALILHSFPGRVFFCNSGTEANEAAFKLMRRHGQTKKDGAQKIVAFENSFHERTAAAMSMTGNEKIRSGFGKLIPDIEHIPAELAALDRVFDAHGGEICGIILEPVQGEGGVRPLPTEVIRRARELATEHNAVLVFDEIQCGMGRSGKLFAYEHSGVVPDAMTLAKSLGGGLPLGCMIVGEDHAQTLEAGMHGSTFGGNHLACRVGYEVLKVMVGREIPEHAASLSEYFFGRLKEMQGKVPAIQEIRGLGLMIGIELDRPSRPIVDRCLEKGLIVNATADRVIRLLPPLNIDLDLAARGLDLLEEALLELR